MSAPQKNSSVRSNFDSALLLFGALMAFWKLIYEGYILPQSLPPYLQVEQELKIAGEDQSYYLIELKITLKNSSQRRINIAKLNYDITGINFSQGTDLDTSLPYQYNLKDKSWANINDEQLDLHTEHVVSESKTLGCGNLITHHWLEAGDSDSRTTIIPISKKYSVASLRSIALFTKKEIGQNIFYNLFISKDCEFMNLFSKQEFQDQGISQIAKEHNTLINKLEILQQTNTTEIYLKKS